MLANLGLLQDFIKVHKQERSCKNISETIKLTNHVYAKYKNLHNKLIKQATDIYYKSFFEKIKKNTKAVWNLIYEISNNTDDKLQDSIDRNNLLNFFIS